MRAHLTLVFLLMMPVAAVADDFRLALPLDCEPAKTCFVQNFVDTDPGAGAKDYGCGEATYDGHTGTDIRVAPAAAAQGVVVRAAAAGVVRKTREGVADRLVVTDADRATANPIGLGNAVIVDHGNGYETIYAHLRNGSVKFRSGDRVQAGDALGEVGLSGLTQFTHLHLEVRYRGEVLDPFLGSVVKGDCTLDPTALPAASIWEAAVGTKLLATGPAVFEAGFLGAPPDANALEAAPSEVVAASADAPALVFYARASHLAARDRLRLTVTGPDGFAVASDERPLDRAKAQYMAFAGKKRKLPRWPAGRYRGKAEVIRDGDAIAVRELSFEINP
jgi:hypothetical protein